MKQHYDIVIVGGGLVGATLAIALKNSRYNIAVLEFNQPSQKQESTLNQRAIVLSKASQNILCALGLWTGIQEFATPITSIHVSNKGHVGAVRLSAKEHNVDALGYVALAQCLYQNLQDALSNVDVFYGAKFEELQRVDGQAVVSFQCDGMQKVTADLVVAADGSNSSVRKQQQIATTKHDYGQHVVICNVQLQRDHGNCAYERFTSQGPCAMLPIAEKTCAVVYATTSVQAEMLTQLPKQAFIDHLQNHFGYRLGKFIDVNKPFSFPLSFSRANEVIKNNLVLIGNAAQTLHPIAGQGLNLGLRDMSALAELLMTTSKPIGSLELLNDYVQWRQFDRRHIMGLTHSLVTLFSTDFLPVNLGTTAGIMMLERVPAMRKLFAQASMGLLGKLPKLACGIAL